jgi:hypothetical protein
VGRGPVETAQRILERLGLAMPPNVERARAQGDWAALAAALRYVGDDDTRVGAARALAEDDGEGVEVLLGALAAPDSRVRAAASGGLVRVAWNGVDETLRARAGARLTAALQDPDSDVRRAGAGALGRVGGTGAVSALRAAAKDPEEGVRLAATSALGRLLPNKIRHWEFEPPTLDWTPPPAPPKPVEGESEGARPACWPDGCMPHRDLDVPRYIPDLHAPQPKPADAGESPVPPTSPELPAPPSAPSPPAREGPTPKMVACPRCQRMAKAELVRCRRCGASLHP